MSEININLMYQSKLKESARRFETYKNVMTFLGIRYPKSISKLGFTRKSTMSQMTNIIELLSDENIQDITKFSTVIGGETITPDATSKHLNLFLLERSKINDKFHPLMKKVILDGLSPKEVSSGVDEQRLSDNCRAYNRHFNFDEFLILKKDAIINIVEKIGINHFSILSLTSEEDISSIVDGDAVKIQDSLAIFAFSLNELDSQKLKYFIQDHLSLYENAELIPSLYEIKIQEISEFISDGTGISQNIVRKIFKRKGSKDCFDFITLKMMNSLIENYILENKPFSYIDIYKNKSSNLKQLIKDTDENKKYNTVMVHLKRHETQLKKAVFKGY